MKLPLFRPAGDSAVVLEWDWPVSPRLNSHIISLKEQLEQADLPGVAEAVPAYDTLLIYYDPLVIEYPHLVCEIKRLLPGVENARARRGRTVRIPVFYGGHYGPDLGYIASARGISEELAVKKHSGAVYRVYALGFLPGFPYMGFVDESIAVPRRSGPRLSVPAGSVGIAGRQTGIYSLTSPGGWQIIGRTPVRLVRPESGQFLFAAGDRVIFLPVGEEAAFNDFDPDNWSDLYGPGESD
ncbi:MAG: hypothetical protein JL50_13150 [Peptococcaceae bacterium BICA1-7]|nr:MAG: hypothetical protein JL50_13150 [Peptococcaceae bacterium BICA1-7]HBV99429.1 hypothetical protein [Desulfotomaculum sp.]